MAGDIDGQKKPSSQGTKKQGNRSESPTLCVGYFKRNTDTIRDTNVWSNISMVNETLTQPIFLDKK